MLIETREYFVYDSKTGEIFEKIRAYSKKWQHKPDRSEWWVLEHIDGEFGKSRWFEPNTSICVGECYLDPSKPSEYKLKDGTQEEFDFFVKNGYIKDSNTA